MISIDGAQGEGGGQVLRTSLALSVATGRPFRMERVRAGRRRPGLLRQHLTAVEAAAAIGDARVEGATLGSGNLEFRPRGLRPGRHELRVGTAGSATLVLQAAIPPLLLASEPSELVIEGGTHVPFAPTAHFLRDALAPLLGKMGARVEVDIEGHGYYPAGGGRLVARIEPAPGGLTPLSLRARGELRARRGLVLLSRIPESVGQREWNALRHGLTWSGEYIVVRETPEAPGPGNAVVLTIEAEELTEVFSAIGEPRRSAESVAAEAMGAARRWLASGVPVGEHLADQLMVPLALAGGGSFRTMAPSSHAKTNDAVLRQFVDLPTRWEQGEGKSWTWTIGQDVGTRSSA